MKNPVIYLEQTCTSQELGDMCIYLCTTFGPIDRGHLSEGITQVFLYIGFEGQRRFMNGL